MGTPGCTKAIFTNGSSIELRPGFVRAVARSHRFQIFVIFSISFFVFTRPYESQVDLDRWQAISIITAMGSMVFAIYFAALAFLSHFGGRLRIRRFHTIWLVLLTSLLTSFLGQLSLAIFDQPQLSIPQTLLLWGFHFAIFAGLEVLFGIYVLPDLQPRRAPPDDGANPQRAPPPQMTLRLRPPQASAQPAAPVALPAPRIAADRDDLPAIVISDRRFPARAIRSVMSQEHYISISLFGGEAHFLRGRIRDFLGQVPEDLGYCIHRSHWVSWSGIDRVATLKDSMMVILDDGTELPVARGRRSDFIARWNRRVQRG